MRWTRDRHWTATFVCLLAAALFWPSTASATWADAFREAVSGQAGRTIEKLSGNDKLAYLYFDGGAIVTGDYSAARITISSDKQGSICIFGGAMDFEVRKLKAQNSALTDANSVAQVTLDSSTPCVFDVRAGTYTIKAGTAAAGTGIIQASLN